MKTEKNMKKKKKKKQLVVVAIFFFILVFSPVLFQSQTLPGVSLPVGSSGGSSSGRSSSGRSPQDVPAPARLPAQGRPGGELGGIDGQGGTDGPGRIRLLKKKKRKLF